jgi:hypothetical protein
MVAISQIENQLLSAAHICDMPAILCLMDDLTAAEKECIRQQVFDEALTDIACHTGTSLSRFFSLMLTFMRAAGPYVSSAAFDNALEITGRKITRH